MNKEDKLKALELLKNISKHKNKETKDKKIYVSIISKSRFGRRKRIMMKFCFSSMGKDGYVFKDITKEISAIAEEKIKKKYDFFNSLFEIEIKYGIDMKRYKGYTDDDIIINILFRLNIKAMELDNVSKDERTKRCGDYLFDIYNYVIL